MGRGGRQPDEGSGVSCGGGGVHDVEAGLVLIGQGLAMLAGARAWSLSDAQLRAATMTGDRAVGGP